MRPAREKLLPLHAMLRQQLTDFFDELIFFDTILCSRLRCLVLLAVLDRRDGGAEDQVLDLHFAFGLLVAALDDGAGRATPVGIFHLRAELAGAEIEFGADT